MFTGIIEEVGKVQNLKKVESNLNISICSTLIPEIKINQSIAHNGTCLTVVDIPSQKTYTVTAIEETLNKTNLAFLKEGDLINLERSLQLKDRLDGHLVQGHVDQVATCTGITDANGSWVFTFSHDEHRDFQTIEKGSIAVNGVSLTTFDVSASSFSVAIIPYTHKYTNFHLLKKGDVVNLEFDMISKHIVQLYKRYKS